MTEPLPTEPTPPAAEDGGSRLSTPWIVTIVVALVFAVPAAAAVLIENLFRGDVEVADSCFVAAAGSDAESTLFTFDATATVTDPDSGVALVEQRLSATAMAGDRVVYADAVSLGNDCGGSIAVAFAPSGEPTVPASVVLRLLVEDPSGGTVGGLPGSWTEVLAVADGSAAGGATVAIADGETRTLAVVADAAADAEVGAAGEVAWVATVAVD